MTTKCDQCGAVDPDDIHTCEAKAGPAQEPLFWYRPRSDGMYEGPIHNAQIEQVRKQSGAWVPLVPVTAQRQWVDLSQEERLKCLDAGNANGWIGVMDATQAKLREKNAGKPEPLSAADMQALIESLQGVVFDVYRNIKGLRCKEVCELCKKLGRTTCGAMPGKEQP